MQIKEIIDTLEEFAPLALQEDYDNAGVQVQSVPDEKVSGILLCLDVTEEVIDEAVRKNCNMIVSHHPLLFHSQKKITTNDYVGRCICKAIRNGVTLYAAHTNLDNAKGGVNFMMAEKMGLQNVRFLVPDVSGSGGSGIIGELPESMSKEKFVAEVRRIFRAGVARYNDCCRESVRTVALCGGAGSFLVSDAIARKADAFITGEISYHHFFGYENDILLVELGHFETEQYTVQLLRRIITDSCRDIPVYETECKTNPVNYL